MSATAAGYPLGLSNNSIMSADSSRPQNDRRLAQELRSLFAARSVASEQRGWKRQPVAGLAISTDSPAGTMASPRALELRIGNRNRRQQCLCIGMDRPLVDGVARRDLDDPPRIHGSPPVRDVQHDGEVVGNKEIDIPRSRCRSCMRLTT